MIDLSVLNEEQKEAVLDNKNNLLLLACAGSGKTLTITYKIAWAIENGFVYPGQVCAVTFTNRAAKEMRDRLENLLPNVDTSRMVVRTFHSLCASLLRRFGTSLGLSPDFTIYDDDDSFQVLCNISKRDKKELREISKSISKVKDIGLTPDDDGCVKYSDYHDFRTLYRAYENALRETGNVDFADLIGKAVELLKTNEEALRYCHNRFKLVLVDEYQDSNSEQFKFLKLFVSPSSQLVAVGDDDQSIYSFRGAEIRNILSFSKDFSDVREIKLEKNYRSTDQILAPSSALIKHNKNRHDKEIVSADKKSGSKPVVIVSQNGVMEAKRVCSIIQGCGDYNNTAILYRTNAQSLAFETELTQRRIPYKVIGALKFYDREEIKDSLSFLRLLLNHSDSVSFRRIINKPSRKIGEKKLEDILSRNNDLFLALTSFSIDNPMFEGARTFLNAWKNAEKRLDDDVSLGELMFKALEETGLKELYESERDRAIRQSRLDNLSQLVSTLEENTLRQDSIAENLPVTTGREALSQFLERLTLDSTVLGDDDNRDKEGVTLITMHNTKGLEYDTVFCVGLEDEIIPGRNKEDDESKEEERRILYVAMTRARKKLYLSYATLRMLWGNFNNEHPSSFLKEIPLEFLSGDTEGINGNPHSFSSSFSSQAKPQYYYSNTPSWAKGIVDISKKESVTKPREDKKQLELKVGDRVKAQDKGEGVITDVAVSPDKTILTVLYDSGRKMRYVAGHANIEKI